MKDELPNAGDLAIVVRNKHKKTCSGVPPLGAPLTVLVVRHGRGRCKGCGLRFVGQFCEIEYQGRTIWPTGSVIIYPRAWLRRIPPLAELEGKETEEGRHIEAAKI